MRRIRRTAPEPKDLLVYRKETGVDGNYDEFAHKESLRDPLLCEQGYLCCYCMCRIAAHDMKVEHFLSQAKHPAEQLSWRNMLAACDRSRGQPWSSQTCDVRKGDRDLTLDPRSETVRRIRYLADGRIVVDDEKLQEDIDEVLNLNVGRLVRGRKSALDGMVAALKRKLGASKRWTRARLQSELGAQRGKEQLPEYLGIVEYWMEKKIARTP